MDGGEGGDERDPPPRRAAPGQVWLACALCRRPVELSDAVASAAGHVCPGCALRV